jgi:hypothetical protein
MKPISGAQKRRGWDAKLSLSADAKLNNVNLFRLNFIVSDQFNLLK